MASFRRTFLFSFLILGLAASRLLAAEIRAPLNHDCSSAYRELTVTHTVTEYNSGSEPRFHTFNSEEMVNSITNANYTMHVQRWEFSDKTEVLCLLQIDCFHLLKVEALPGTPGTVVIHVKDVLGNRYTVKAMAENKENFVVEDGYRLFNQYTLIPGGWKRLPPEAHLFAESLPLLKKAFERENIAQMNSGQLANYLSARQLATSTNATFSKDTSFSNSILEANRLLANLLRENKPLQMETLEKLNWLANQGVHPYGHSYDDPIAGVVRGTRDRSFLMDAGRTKGEFALVDLSNAQVIQSRYGFTLTHFLPAKDVPRALASLTNRMNAIKAGSNPKAIFALYQEFIRIHPFMDGNGRTGRMLLNYMLLKAELPTMTKPSVSIFHSVDEIFDEYLKNVKNPQNALKEEQSPALMAPP